MTAGTVRRLRLVDGSPPEGRAAPAEGGFMRIAFATQDLKTVDAHFAGARSLAIYDVSPNESRFIEAVQFAAVSGEDGSHSDDHDGRIGPRLEAVRGCTLLFVRAIGGPAAARVVAAKVHPVKLTAPEPIASVIDRVQTMLQGSPPPWLRKALHQQGAGDLVAEEPA